MFFENSNFYQRYPIMDDLTYSRRNCPYYKATTAEVSDKLARVLRGYEAERRKNGHRALSANDRELYRRHFELVVLDLYAAWGSDPRKFIGYSRGKSAFIRGGAYWHPKKDKPLLSETAFKAVIKHLEKKGFLENHNAKSGYGKLSSRMRATPTLVSVLKTMGINWTSIGVDPDAPVILVKDKKKKVLPYPEDADFDVEAAERNLRRINENLDLTYINLNITDDAYQDLLERIDGESTDSDHEPREPIEFSNRSLRRVFRDDFSKGGRFYGGWWQGLPSDVRKHIVIDGAMTREMDFSTNQPRILYAKKNIKPPEDSYIPSGWPKEVRPISKKLFYQIVNADKSSRHETQWRRFAPDIDPDPKPDNWDEMEKHQKAVFRRYRFEQEFNRPFFDLLRDLIAMHAPVDRYLFSKMWGEIQRIDSDVAEQVMIRLLDKDVPVTVLPIHDSFIVRRGAENELLQTMKEAFLDVVGAECEVDWDEAVYDTPDEYNGPSLIRMADLVDESVNEMNEKKEYIKREHEWQRAHGPVDV